MPSKIEIPADDGVCPAYVFRPPGSGPWPAVLFYMDGIGIRPALFEMGERIAGHGYYVILPDLFYRSGPYEPMDAKRLFADPELQKVMRSRFGQLDQAAAMRDTRAVLDFLDRQSDVSPGKRGATGYCMGGRMALVAAGSFPDRFAAVALYHPGHVATDAPDSPHLLAPQIKARIYVGGASDDATFPEAQKQRLEAALRDARVDHTVETYPARHGWVPTDTPVHDQTAAEQHWQTLSALLDGALRG